MGYAADRSIVGALTLRPEIDMCSIDGQVYISRGIQMFSVVMTYYISLEGTQYSLALSVSLCEFMWRL